MTASEIKAYNDLVFLLANLVRKPDEIDKLVDLAGIDNKPVIDTQADSWVNWTAAIQSALQHDGALGELVECAARVRTAQADEIRSTYRRCNGASVDAERDTSVADVVEDGAPTSTTDDVRRRLGEIREGRRVLLGAKSVAGAKQAVDKIHTNAGTLCAQLDNPRDRSAWCVIWADSKDREQLLDRVELRLLDIIRWSAYVLRLSENQLTAVDELHPVLANEESSEQAHGATAAARLVDAYINLALEIRRLLRILDEEDDPEVRVGPR